MRRRTGPAAGVAILVLLLGSILLAPAQAAAVAKAMVGPPVGLAGPEARQGTDSFIDEVARVFAFGRPDVLIQSGLHLAEVSAKEGEWLPRNVIPLAWTDLGHDGIRYDVFVGAEGTGVSEATLATNVAQPRANVSVPGDGSYTVWIRPRAGDVGRLSEFGPFRVDSTPPPSPLLTAPAEPPGYRFAVSWTSVDDDSGLQGYELQRRLGSTSWVNVTSGSSTSHVEDQIGNGQYQYQVRAINGAGLASEWSVPVAVFVKAPMSNPGVGSLTYGIRANYTGLLHLWDLSNPGIYSRLEEIPTELKDQYLRAEPAIETGNATLQAIVTGVLGNEQNTLLIAEKLFIYLFDYTDYDSTKASGADTTLQRAGETLDLGRGICGDLAVLYITLLRIAGVPARPVHGYLDNALSGVGGFHMWVEVYVGPENAARSWMSVDVSGVSGSFSPDDLFPYFGIFNPDYLALGNELNYERFDDLQWNTWARFRYTSPRDQNPQVSDDSAVVDYESEMGRLFFDPVSKRTEYRPCQSPDASNAADPCPNEPGPPGFSRYYGMKGVSKKWIDYGARLESNLPSCLKVELRYPMVDPYGAVVPDQSSIYTVYENQSSSQTKVGTGDEDGWVTFLDGTSGTSTCQNL